MGISAVTVTIKECINLLRSCPCSCDTVRMECSDVKFHVDRMSICLGRDFSRLCRFWCFHSRITGSGQLDWSTARKSPGWFLSLGPHQFRWVTFKVVAITTCLSKIRFNLCVSVPAASVWSASCGDGEHSTGAAQPQLLLSSKCSRRRWSSVCRRGERGSDSLCVAPAQTFPRAPGCAVLTRGLLLFSVHHLFPDGHRLTVALELFHNGQTLLALQTKQQQSRRWCGPTLRPQRESKGLWIFVTAAKLWALFPVKTAQLTQNRKFCRCLTEVIHKKEENHLFFRASPPLDDSFAD